MQREQFRYQPYYCEENIWNLCQAPELSSFQRYVVFVSNPSKCCALWFQKASRTREEPVVWDYHVILLCKQEHWMIWDLDTTLHFPIPLSNYLEATFWGTPMIPEVYSPWFRVIEADIFLKTFSSDRSHMLNEKGEFIQEPPKWPLCQAQPNEMNLMQFVQMQHLGRDTFVGEVFALPSLRAGFLE